ncbi:DUF3397 domain-containing protein [Levilactobacillus namurensis]|uniref:DUF3397 domain-containing protein n=1 Tax=Levilactobacillus namurensis TaxID=380393 RepID=UPI00223096EF|nr:DUF3397 domain-containing protein [Levilactobacillus namurensis]MCW3778011.1 DUF3397 domain-containing protein [Levilactobacillus namurensis]MDT7018359.1 DUF3397 domain-containing protein [Levilactobacillus namurensis]WNN64655.1 DUF3397 domain-containing protein [Levilactobacillus namurensis]
MTFWTSPVAPLVILIVGWLVIRGIKHRLRRHWPAQVVTWDLMTPLLIICSLLLIPAGAGRWLPWLVMGWMVLGMGVAIVQAIRRHELLYPVFFKTFWRLTDVYWVVGFGLCFLLTFS